MSAAAFPLAPVRSSVWRPSFSQNMCSMACMARDFPCLLHRPHIESVTCIPLPAAACCARQGTMPAARPPLTGTCSMSTSLSDPHQRQYTTYRDRPRDASAGADRLRRWLFPPSELAAVGHQDSRQVHCHLKMSHWFPCPGYVPLRLHSIFLELRYGIDFFPAEDPHAPERRISNVLRNLIRTATTQQGRGHQAPLSL